MGSRAAARPPPRRWGTGADAPGKRAFGGWRDTAWTHTTSCHSSTFALYEKFQTEKKNQQNQILQVCFFILAGRLSTAGWHLRRPHAATWVLTPSRSPRHMHSCPGAASSSACPLLCQLTGPPRALSPCVCPSQALPPTVHPNAGLVLGHGKPEVYVLSHLTPQQQALACWWLRLGPRICPRNWS